ncbi:MBL fold metallo-hydrolase [Psychromicrobium lacuslunae]|uniref:MBL fold metallo-hydrolase n=1 Tax=Psychromicrobium lacuslunae TaxID=1618207 RepID=UPI0005D45C98|nr:MBL fold metallo-hydrolase [Psychromicrobium lacuslunae]
MRWKVQDSVSEVASGIFFVQGPASNWTIIRDVAGAEPKEESAEPQRGEQTSDPGSERFLLVDTGYPGDREKLLESIAWCGLELSDCCGVVVTHAHSDHIGSAKFLAEQGIPIYAHALELPNLRREVSEQVTLADFGWRVMIPRVLRWLRHAVRVGGLSDVSVAEPQEVSAEVLGALPGAAELILTGVHTSGHLALYLPEAGVLLSGDVVVTGHPLSRWQGPQTLPKLFHHQPELIAQGIEKLKPLNVRLLLPGHGPYLRVEQEWFEQVRVADYWPYR